METVSVSQSPQSASGVAQFSGDEIDLVEILAIAWRLRYATIAGATLGLVGGLLFSAIRTPTYETTVPVTILRDSLPANVDSKKVVEMYASALGAPDIAAAAFGTLASGSKQFAQNMKANNITLNDFVRAQTSLENVGKPNKALLQVLSSASGNDFFITAKLPVSGFAEQARIIVMNAINSAGNIYNMRETQTHIAQTKGALAEVEKSVGQVISRQESALVNAFASQVRVKAELAGMEYSLQRSVGAEGANFARLSQGAPVTVVVSNAGAAENKTVDAAGSGAKLSVTAADFERLVRLKAMLVHDKRMSSGESVEFDSRLARLQLKSERMHADLEPLITGIETGRDLVAKAQREAMMPLDRKTFFVPLFTFDSVMSPEEARMVRVERTSGAALPVAGGAFMGAMFGFLGMALFKFVRRNQKRLAELIAKED